MAADNRVLYEFDLANSPVTTLPSSWLTQAPELRYYQGLMWYQRNFSVPADHPTSNRGRSFLRFGAANYSTVVYLNGQPVGRHEGGFTPFTFEVSKLLRAGNNQITVGVDSQATDATVPPPVTDWENYGGITRSIRLISTPDTYVDSASLQLTRDGQIAVAAHLDGPQARSCATSSHRGAAHRSCRHH
jgi:beta-glucuronidase